MKYPWVLQIDVVTKVWWFLVFSVVVNMFVVMRASARTHGPGSCCEQVGKLVDGSF